MSPERSCARCWVLRDRAGRVCGRSDLLDFVRRHGFGRVGEEYRPYFENYTVDASILKDADEIDRDLFL